MSALEAALLEETALRSRLNALVREHAEALQEAERLQVQAARPDASADLSATAGRWSAVAARLAGELDEQRAKLREQQALVERLRVEGAGG